MSVPSREAITEIHYDQTIVVLIESNSQMLDGGAMFENAPRSLWAWVTPDDQNRIPLKCRCLLIKDGSKRS